MLVLGQFGGDHYADVIAARLGDPDVSEHALHALRKLKDGRFVETARKLENDPPTGATRTEARSYPRAFQSPASRRPPRTPSETDSST